MGNNYSSNISLKKDIKANKLELKKLKAEIKRLELKVDQQYVKAKNNKFGLI